MPTTPNFALPYPVLADTSDVPRDIKALADQVDAAVRALIPAGTIVATARSTAPTGWTMCGGFLVPIGAEGSTYYALFQAIGHAFNPGPPAGTDPGGGQFRLPDLRGRVPVGVDGTGPSDRLSANDALGNASGAEKHTLTEAQMPAHVHPPFAGTSYYVNFGGGNGNLPGGSVAFGVASATGSTGGDGAHNNMQPYQVVNYIIKL